MALENSKKVLLIILISILTSYKAEAKIILPELLTKQAVSNIRFLSQDGKFTYYQKRSGSLLFSSNYKVIEMVKGELGAQYTVIASPSKQKIVVTQSESYHNFYSLRAKEKIFLTNFGDTVLKEVGMGSVPKLHLKDTWLSYYDYYSKILSFEHTTNSAIKFTIKLNNRINPYFLPQVEMSDENTIYYTDLSETGSVGLLEFKRNVGKSQLIFKAPTPMMKAEICLHNNHLVMGLFGLNFSKEGTTISRSTLPVSDFGKRQSIYSSPVNDIGQLVCNFSETEIIFIKNYGSNDLASTDLVDLNPETKVLKLLSELKTITSVINMDGTLLALDKGKYYIVKGNIDYKNIDSLKALPPSGAAEAMKELDKQIEDE
jgi:hypothetical protein